MPDVQEIEIAPIRVQDRIIKVGGGLNFVVYERGDGSYRWQQHFTPERDTLPIKEPKKQVSRSLDYAHFFYKFYRWWKDFDAQKTGFPRQEIIYGSTNPTMNNFREKLFGKKIYKVLRPDPYREGYWEYELDMVELDKSPEVVEKLKKLSSRKLRSKTKSPVEITP